MTSSWNLKEGAGKCLTQPHHVTCHITAGSGAGPALPGNLVEHAASAPQVHLVRVEPIGEKTLWGPVPPGRDVLCVGLLGIDTPA